MKRILVVDDHEEGRYQLQVLLGANGYQVVALPNGGEALAEARRHPPDLVVSDILMPVMDGFALCREWRKDERLRTIPFVFYTATYTDTRDRDFALGLGADSFMVKPEEPDVLLRTLGELLEVGSHSQAPTSPAPGGEGSRDETRILQQYNEALIRKLEDKTTQLEHANRALRESEARYRQLFESSIDAVLLTVPDRTILSANPAACTMFGRSEEQLQRLGCEQVVDPADERLAPALEERARTGQFRGELTFVRGDGSTFPGELSSAIFRTPEGEARSSTVVRDVTERRRAEEALKQSEVRFRSYFELAGVGFAITSPTAAWLEVNDTLCGMLGYSREEVQRTTWTALTHPEDVDKDVAQFKRALAGEIEGYTLDKRFLRKDGESIWTSLSVRCVRRADGGAHYFATLLFDITDRKKGEQERERLATDLARAQKLESIGRLAGGVAHDFNNALGIVLGHAEMALRRIPPGDRLRRDLNAILDAAVRSANLTRQLLAFARRQAITPKLLDLNESVAGMLGMLRRIIGEDIQLAWLPGPALWPVKLDPAQIDQLLVNLVVNARDAIGGVGRISVETGNAVVDETFCAHSAGAKPGEYVMIVVSDDGCGMEKNVLDHLFEPFFTTKEEGKGTGLGLATVYGIVQQNCGFVNVYSEPGAGATFKLYLPRAAGERSAEGIAVRREPPQARGETVLLLEDDTAMLEITAENLADLGYSVLTAMRPSEALKIAESHSGEIHLLLTDVVMPEMNGRDVAQRLVALRPKTRCLYLSGYTADVITHRGVLDADVRFLQKPFSRLDLAVKVRQTLDD